MSLAAKKVRLCYRGSNDADSATDIASARYFVEIGWGRLNATETRIRLNFTKEEARSYVKLMDGSPNRFHRVHLAESLRMGLSTMNKAAIEDSRYHQQLAETYRGVS